MSAEFKKFLFLYIICAVLIFSGFYLTALPIVVQIILLASGVLLTIYTLLKITLYFMQQSKKDKAHE